MSKTDSPADIRSREGGNGMEQRYELFNEILFDSYCKTCISNAILKERERKSARLQAATPFSSFPAEFLSMIPQPEMEEDDDSDDYCLVTMGKKRIRVKSRTLGQAMLSLLPKDREIVMRYYSFGENDGAIAQHIGMTRPTVQRHRVNTVKKLREMLEIEK